MVSASLHVCPLSPLAPLPRATSAIAGSAGVIREQLEDFVVDELPLYEPCGEGEHLYLWIEKRDVSGPSLRRHLARALRISDRTIGMAGLKDRRAVTRQWVSVPAQAAERVGAINDDRVRVLDQIRHRNKLRTGHLAGNRFQIRLRGTAPGDAERLRAKLELLGQTGLPNFYGPQRMGHGGATLAAGWALSQGHGGLLQLQMADERVHRVDLRDRLLRRLAASALQSEVFNRTLAARMAQGIERVVMPGDVCQKIDTGGQFPSDDAVREQGRLQRGEVRITGPMWGPKMRLPLEEAGAFERGILDRFGLSTDDFARIGALASGTRRALHAQVDDIGLQADADGIVVSFSLPAGSFATVLLHELADDPDAVAPAPTPPESVGTSPDHGEPCA